MFFIEMAVVVRAAAQQEIRFKFTTWYLWPPAEKTPHCRTYRDGSRCTRCGATGDPLQVHHVVPVAAGGKDTPSNCSVVHFLP